MTLNLRDFQNVDKHLARVNKADRKLVRNIIYPVMNGGKSKY